MQPLIIRCNKFKCKHCLKFSINCNSCIKKRCKNFNEFNKSKDLLFNCGIPQIENFVRNFLVDYFNLNDVAKEFFKMDISEEVQKKDPLYIYSEKIQKMFYYIDSNTNEKIQYNFNGNKRCDYLKKVFFLLKSSVFFSFIAMNPNFKNRFDLKKKKIQMMHKTILPSLNEYSYCNFFKWGYCLKFSPKCGACKIRRCTYCS